MRMSCNGCRVLRKGCSENCSIKPCLQWIKTSESQANATVFLAKFYGRAGLLNLINAGPEDLRPAIFRSLLYEACGRIVNPIYGSVGLLWSGSWHLCQSAVESVLRGVPVTKIASEAAVGPPMKACDIRHVSKDENSVNLHKVRAPHRFKRSSGSSKALSRRGRSDEPKSSSPSYDSSVSHPEERESKETESMVSSETAEAPPLLLTETQSVPSLGDADLELSLGFRPYSVSM